MKRLIVAAALSFLFLMPAKAQNTSFGFSPTGQTQTMSVTAASSTLALNSGQGTTVIVQNTGTVTVYIKVTGGVATTADFPIQGGWVVVLNIPPNQTIAAIAASTTASVTFSRGYGATVLQH